MAKRRRGCAGCLVSLLIFVVIVVGGALGIYNFASPSTFGITKIGDFELGELADYKFKDIWGALKDLTTEPDVSDVTTNTYGDAEKSEAQATWGADSSTIGESGVIADINDNISEEGTAIENLADLLTTQVVTTTHMSLSFKGNDFVYLFNEIIGEAQNMSDEYADLKELIDMFSVDGNIPLEIHEITLTNSDGAVNVRTVFGLNITKFKSQIDEVLQSVPAFIRPNIGTTLYITSNSTLTVSAENGELGVDSGSTLRINTMDENMSSSILNLIISMMDAPDMTPQTVAELISSVFTRISNNLGGVGTLSGQTPTYGAAAISGEPAKSGGTINLVTRVTSVVTQPQE